MLCTGRELTRYDVRGWRATFYTTGMEFPRHVTMAPLHVASLGRQWSLASAPFACTPVENHIAVPVREFMLEVQIVFGLGARHDEDQVCHARLRRIPDADLLQL